VKHLIIGYGEVGQGLEKVLIEQDGKENVAWYDLASTCAALQSMYHVVHICFPYCKNFENIVLDYLRDFEPNYCVIHSTVQVGTTRKIQDRTTVRVFVSPIQGAHPGLDKGIRAFKKWVGVKGLEEVEIGEAAARKIFSTLRCRIAYPYETVELAKLLDLSRYGLSISFAKEQNEICKEHGVQYSEVVKEWELDYNEGLMLEGRSQYIRPIIYPPEGKIGGHCVVAAMEKIRDDSALVTQALALNQSVEEEELDSTVKERLTFAPEEVVDGKNVLIEVGVKIGKGTKIWHFTNIMEKAEIGDNCVIGSYVEIGKRVHIGDECKIQAGAFIPEGVWIGRRVFIGPNVVFTNDKCPRVGRGWIVTKTFVHDGVAIGANATIVCGVEIGRDAVIGAGAVVTKDVPPGEVWCGCPARKLVKETAEEIS
jgi:acetyltransferase-like isoleucine patch superfamily enzyme